MSDFGISAASFCEMYGIAIVPIRPRSKIPRFREWQNRVLAKPVDVRAHWRRFPSDNVACSLHASGLVSLDIDHVEHFTRVMTDYGYGDEISGLRDAPTVVGNPKRFRVMYRVPAGVQLPYGALKWPVEGEPEKMETIFELRSASADSARFDLLPPSAHPHGHVYRWSTSLPRTLDEWPEPPAWLLDFWLKWHDVKEDLARACPWAKDVPAPTPAPASRASSDGVSVIDEFNRRVSIHDALSRCGYTRKARDRYLSPHSTSGLAGVYVDERQNHAYVHHASDPMSERGRSGNAPVKPFDLFCYYEHNDDSSVAAKAAAKKLGLGPPEKRPSSKLASNLVDRLNGAAPKPSPKIGPFRPLGYDDTHGYYIPSATQRIVAISMKSHTDRGNLLRLAPLEWWSRKFPTESGGVDWTSAGDQTLRACERAGYHRPDLVRGRGAWRDGDSVVINQGDRLLIDGVESPIGGEKTEATYIASTPAPRAQPLNDASDVAKILKCLNMSAPDLTLLAGWIMIAPICGVLPWRPHVWITAEKGSGKSWIQKEIVRPLLGANCLFAQGNSTEASLRQEIKNDAMPVLFDEAEGEGVGAARMQRVLEYARACSSGGMIIKGSQSGRPIMYSTYSAFLFSSINTPITMASDRSRISVIHLRPNPETEASDAAFRALEILVMDTLTREYCDSFVERCERLAPTILRSSQVLLRAIVESGAERRAADQFAPLLAGAHHLVSNDVITPDEAAQYASAYSWDRVESEFTDEHRLLDHITQHTIRYESRADKAIERSVAELAMAAFDISHCKYVDLTSPDDANRVLRRHGMLVRDSCLYVSNTHPKIQAILRSTSWQASWSTVLERIEGAGSTGTVSFSGHKSRSVAVPMRHIEFDQSDNPKLVEVANELPF